MSMSRSAEMPNMPCGLSNGSPCRTVVAVEPADSRTETRPRRTWLVAESAHAPDQRLPPKSRPLAPLNHHVGTASVADRVADPSSNGPSADSACCRLVKCPRSPAPVPSPVTQCASRSGTVSCQMPMSEIGMPLVEPTASNVDHVSIAGACG